MRGLYLNKNCPFVDVDMRTSSSLQDDLITMCSGRIQLRRPGNFSIGTSPENHHGEDSPWSQQFIKKLESASSKYQEERGSNMYHLCVHIIDVQVPVSDNAAADDDDCVKSKEVKVRVHGFLCDILQELDSGKFMLRLQIGINNHPQLNTAGSAWTSFGHRTDEDHDFCILEEKYFEGNLPSGSVFHETTHSEIRGFVDVILYRDKLVSADRIQMLDVCRKILEDQIHTDMTIVASNGKELGCNRNFLAAQSPVFANMLQTRMKEAESRRIEMVDMDEGDVRAFLKYLYYMDITVPRENSSIALRLLQAGHTYDIPQLEAEMKGIFCWKPASWCDPEVALALFLFARELDDCHELKMKAVDILKLKVEDWSIVSLKELVLGNMELATKVLYEIFQLSSSEEFSVKRRKLN